VVEVIMDVNVGWNIAVGTATSYGLDGPGIWSRWERDFSHLFRPTLGAIQPPVKWVPALLPVGKTAWVVVFLAYPYLAWMLKKEYSYSSMLPLCLYGLIQSKLYFAAVSIKGFGLQMCDAVRFCR